jgi:hypothetical protein
MMKLFTLAGSRHESIVKTALVGALAAGAGKFGLKSVKAMGRNLGTTLGVGLGAADVIGGVRRGIPLTPKGVAPIIHSVNVGTV